MPTEQQVLSEEAVREIETAQVQRRESLAFHQSEYPGLPSPPYIDEIDALCQTVRVLRAENDLADKVFKFILPNNPLATISELAKPVLDEVDQLRARLSEVEKERDDLRETLTSLRDCQNKPVCGHCNALLRAATTEIEERLNLAPPAPDEADKALAQQILKKISEATLELAFVRHDLTSDEVDVDEDADVKERVAANEEFLERLKEDTLNCLTGDDFGCLDPEELDASNCELIWLTAALAQARSEGHRQGVRDTWREALKVVAQEMIAVQPEARERVLSILQSASKVER